MPSNSFLYNMTAFIKMKYEHLTIFHFGCYCFRSQHLLFTSTLIEVLVCNHSREIQFKILEGKFLLRVWWNFSITSSWKKWPFKIGPGVALWLTGPKMKVYLHNVQISLFLQLVTCTISWYDILFKMFQRQVKLFVFLVYKTA